MTILANQQHDGRCESIPVVISKAVLEPPLNQHPARVVRVRLEKLATGCWSVRAATSGRGGLFRDYASATQYIRHEFAARQRTIVETVSA
jgi:hypothetical protein